MKENEYIYFCFRLCLSLSAYIEMKGTVWFILVIIIEIQLSDGKKGLILKIRISNFHFFVKVNVHEQHSNFLIIQ